MYLFWWFLHDFLIPENPPLFAFVNSHLPKEFQLLLYQNHSQTVQYAVWQPSKILIKILCINRSRVAPKSIPFYKCILCGEWTTDSFWEWFFSIFLAPFPYFTCNVDTRVKMYHVFSCYPVYWDDCPVKNRKQIDLLLTNPYWLFPLALVFCRFKQCWFK